MDILISFIKNGGVNVSPKLLSPKPFHISLDKSPFLLLHKIWSHSQLSIISHIPHQSVSKCC